MTACSVHKVSGNQVSSHKVICIEVSPAKVQILFCESGHILSKVNTPAIVGIEYIFSEVLPDNAMQFFTLISEIRTQRHKKKMDSDGV